MRARPEISRERLLEALEQAGGQRKRAAAILGVGRATLYRWMERHGLSRETGRLIAGRYEIVRELGRGRFSNVFLVRDRASTRRERALKLLRDAVDEAEAERLREEFRAFARLRHPGLVRVHDFGRDETTGKPFLVMERVRGTPFSQAVDGVTLRVLLERFGAVLDAVRHLHAHGLVHRDLKSENVFVRETSGDEPAAVTVLDLGLGEPLAGPELPAGGTLLYCAPELLDGARASARSDIYALGVMLYLALCGRPPFDGDDVREIVEAHRAGRPVRPGALRSGLPAELDRFVQRLLDPDPAERFPDCGAARESLASILEGAGAACPPILPPGAAGFGELVGRADEVDQLAGELAEPSGDGRVLVAGEAGIGKSRLLEAVSDELRSRGCRVALATCSPGDAHAARPLAELIAAVTGGAAGDGAGRIDRLMRRHAGALAGLDPGRWGSLAGGGGAGAVAGGASGRAQLIEAVSDLLQDLAGPQPVVLVLDDLHQADDLVLDVLRLLSGRGREDGARLLAGTRPQGGVVDDLEAAGAWRVHRLGPLDEEAVSELTARILGAAKGSLLGHPLYELTGGHPLYLHAVLHELAEAPATAETGSLPEELPKSLAQALRARVGRCSRSARAWLEALAVRDAGAWIAELEAVTGVDRAEALGELTQLGLLERDGADAVAFAHALLRDALRESLPGVDSRRWHREWARRLEGDPDRVVERAGHLLAAGVAEAERETFLAAADQLERRWRHGRAARFLEAALASLGEDDPRRLDLYERWERACRIVRDGDQAVEVCGRWAGLAGRIGRGDSQARALAMLASWHRERGEIEEGLRAADEAVRRADQAGDPAVLGDALKVRGSARWIAWRREAARGDFERALECVLQSGDPVRIGFCLADVGLPRAQRGDMAGAMRAFEEALGHLSDPEQKLWALLTRTIRGYVLGYCGDLESGIAEIESALADLRRLRAPVALTDPLENLALFQLRTGRYESARETGRELVQEGVRFARPRFRISGLLAMGEACWQLDAREAARDHDRLALELADRHAEPGQMQFARLAVARDLRSDGRHEEAVELAERVHRDASRRGNPRQWGLAALDVSKGLRLQGRYEAAREWRERAWSALSDSWEDAPALRAACLGEGAAAHAREGRPGVAAADLCEALGLVRRCGPVSLELDLWLALAETESQRQRDGDAAAALGEARRRVEALAAGIRNPEDRARFLARPDLEPVRRRGAVPRPVPGDEGAVPGAGSELEALYEVSRAVAGNGDRGPLFDRAVEIALERVRGDRAALVLRDEQSGELVVAASNGLEEETRREVSRLSRSVIERADLGKPVWVADTSVSPELAHSRSVAAFGIRSVLCVPLRLRGEVLGTLYVDSRGGNRAFDEGSLRFLEAAANQVALALGYSRLLQNLTRERDALRESLADSGSFEGLVGRSAPMRRLFELIERVAPTSVPVVVSGESGTGKELVARAIHRRSPRHQAPFLSENCAAIPEGLLESTLFGHVRGAFTGADGDAPGLFERAHGGTLLLDEVGDMSPALQARLLRVLQEGELRRVGGAQTVSVDVRVIAATHRDLERMVRDGEFRQDLFFRLNGITIPLPALRERREDVAPLVRHFLDLESAAEGRPAPLLEPAVWRALLSYSWPGNVRELHNTVRRLLLLSDGERVDAAALAGVPELRGEGGASSGPGRSRPAGRSIDRAQIEQALVRTGGNRKQAAALLGISRATLYRRLSDGGSP